MEEPQAVPQEPRDPNRKRLIALLAGAAVLILLVCAALIAGGVSFVRGRLPTATSVPEAITRCDLDASGLCLVSFGANANNELVINLKLADEDFPAFYAQVSNRAAESRFRCEVPKAAPTDAYCVGPRTPLGEPLELRLFASEDDRLLAEGTFVLEAVALPTFSNATATELTGDLTGTPEGNLETSTPPGEGGPGPIRTPTPTRTPTRTLTPPIGYPP